MSEAASIGSVGLTHPGAPPAPAFPPTAPALGERSEREPAAGDGGRSSGGLPGAGLPERLVHRGPWHYSLRNARFTLLEQLADRFGVEAPRLAEYNRSPHKTLKRIADDCDLRLESVRRCLEAVLNGAPVRGGRSSTISCILASGESGWGRAQGRLRAARLVTDRDFSGLLCDINGALAVIAHQWPRTPDGHLINDAGASIGEEATKARKLAHILDGAETAVLRAVRGELGEAIEVTGAGWSASGRLDVRRLKTRIQRHTGYRMSVAVKRRKMAGGGQPAPK